MIEYELEYLAQSIAKDPPGTNFLFGLSDLEATTLKARVKEIRENEPRQQEPK